MIFLENLKYPNYRGIIDLQEIYSTVNKSLSILTPLINKFDNLKCKLHILEKELYDILEIKGIVDSFSFELLIDECIKLKIGKSIKESYCFDFWLEYNKTTIDKSSIIINEFKLDDTILILEPSEKKFESYIITEENCFLILTDILKNIHLECEKADIIFYFFKTYEKFIRQNSFYKKVVLNVFFDSYVLTYFLIHNITWPFYLPLIEDIDNICSSTYSFFDRLSLGKYKGKTIRECLIHDFNYLIWCCENVSDFFLEPIIFYYYLLNYKINLYNKNIDFPELFKIKFSRKQETVFLNNNRRLLQLNKENDNHKYSLDMRLYFEAMTDGEFGDYDDFIQRGGNIDDIDTWARG